MTLSNAIATIQRHIASGLSADDNAALQSLAASIRGSSGGRPAKLTPCPHCHQDFGARALRAHLPACDKR